MQKRFRHVDRATIINAVRVRRYIDRSIRRFIDEEKADLLKTAKEIEASKDLFPENAQRAMTSLVTNIQGDKFDEAINDCGVISSAADSNDLKEVVKMSADLAVKILELDKIMKREAVEQKAAAGDQKAQTKLANIQKKEEDKRLKAEAKAAEKAAKVEAKAAEKARKAEEKAAAAAAKKQAAMELKEYKRKQAETKKAIEKFKAQQAKEMKKAEDNVTKAEKAVSDIDLAIKIANDKLEGAELDKQLKTLGKKRENALKKVEFQKKALENLKATRAREMRQLTGNDRQVRRAPVGPGIVHWNLGKPPKAEDRLPLALRRDMMLKKLDRMLKR